MTTRITHITSPEARELEKKKAEPASLEAGRFSLEFQEIFSIHAASVEV